MSAEEDSPYDIQIQKWIVFLKERGLFQTAVSLEMESTAYFSVTYFQQLLISGDLQQADDYFSAFTALNQLPAFLVTLEIRKTLFHELLVEGDVEKARTYLQSNILPLIKLSEELHDQNVSLEFQTLSGRLIQGFKDANALQEMRNLLCTSFFHNLQRLPALLAKTRFHNSLGISPATIQRIEELSAQEQKGTPLLKPLPASAQVPSKVNCVLFHPVNENVVFVGCADGMLYFARTDGSIIHQIDVFGGVPVHGLVSDASGNFLFMFSEERSEVVVLGSRTGILESVSKAAENVSTGIAKLCMSEHEGDPCAVWCTLDGVVTFCKFTGLGSQVVFKHKLKAKFPTQVMSICIDSNVIRGLTATGEIFVLPVLVDLSGFGQISSLKITKPFKCPLSYYDFEFGGAENNGYAYYSVLSTAADGWIIYRFLVTGKWPGKMDSSSAITYLTRLKCDNKPVVHVRPRGVFVCCGGYVICLTRELKLV